MLGVATVLEVFFITRYLASYKVMPAGLMSVLR